MKAFKIRELEHRPNIWVIDEELKTGMSFKYYAAFSNKVSELIINHEQFKKHGVYWDDRTGEIFTLSNYPIQAIKIADTANKVRFSMWGAK